MVAESTVDRLVGVFGLFVREEFVGLAFRLKVIELHFFVINFLSFTVVAFIVEDETPLQASEGRVAEGWTENTEDLLSTKDSE